MCPYKDPYDAYLRNVRRRIEHPENKLYTRQWRKDNPEQAKKHRDKNRKQWDATHTEYRRKQQLAEHMAYKLPLKKHCELCPDDEKFDSEIRHHVDYDYPTIIFSLCKTCHKEVHLDPKSDKPKPYLDKK
jgi:hypothetical protein